MYVFLYVQKKCICSAIHLTCPAARTSACRYEMPTPSPCTVMDEPGAEDGCWRMWCCRALFFKAMVEEG